MARLIDADALVIEFNKRCVGECACCREDNCGTPESKSGCRVIDEAPSVSAITAMNYYYEERDREYAERMDDIWKNM